MSDKPSSYKVVNVLAETYTTIQQIRMQKHMLSENGLPLPLYAVMREIVEYYEKGHKKGSK
jgi:hypothetical protein